MPPPLPSENRHCTAQLQFEEKYSPFHAQFLTTCPQMEFLDLEGLVKQTKNLNLRMREAWRCPAFGRFALKEATRKWKQRSLCYSKLDTFAYLGAVVIVISVVITLREHVRWKLEAHHRFNLEGWRASEHIQVFYVWGINATTIN